VQRGGAGGPLDSDVVDALARSDLLQGLGPAAARELAVDVATQELGAGEQLITTGDAADDVFFVVQGQLEIVLDTTRGGQQLSLLGPGAVVGEIGVLSGDTRSATVRAVTRSRVAAITSERLGRLLTNHPAHAEDLARRATERLRRTRLIEHMTTLFGIIDTEVLAAVEELMEWVSLPAGAQLFAEGDPGDAAYLVATGRLRAFRRSHESGAELEIGEMGRAQLVGELSLLDGEPRTASVYAVRDCQLIRFSRPAYEELLHRYPDIGLEVARMALRRVRGVTDRDHDRRLSVALVPISPTIDVELFAEALTVALGPGARRVTSGQIDVELGRDGIAQIDADDIGALRLAYHLEELEQRHRHLVYGIDETWTVWSRRALRWADHILLVADAQEEPEPGPIERELWALVMHQQHPEVSLALLHPPDTRLPSGTAAWLEPRTLASHHHLRRGDRAHMARLARLLAGTGTSLVLGGGGARGFAHIGILQVLEELGRPVDMIGGSSIGAIMATGPGMGWTAAELRSTALEAFTRLLDYTLPTTSLLRGERITRKLRGIYDGVDIADLWIPTFCVSTNLTHPGAEYHDRGPIVQALRASIAIPGVLPPVPRDGDLLVDGGVLDNVPVDEMRRRNPTGRLLAVDVAPVEGPVAGDDYGLSVSGWRALRRRRPGSRLPRLVPTLVRSSLVASVRDRHRVVDAEVADLYLDVAVEGGGLLDFSTGGQIADSARASARPAIARWLEDGGERAPAYVRTQPGRRTVIAPGRGPKRRGVLLLTLRDLQLRATRFGAVVLGTSVVFALLFLMTGLTEQFHREPRDAVQAIGAGAWLLREGASGAFTSGATMPADVASAIDDPDAAPVVVARHSIAEGGTHTDVVVVGFDAGRLGEPTLVDGRLPATGEEIVIDDSSGLALGADAVVGPNRYVVSGHTDRTTMFAGMPLVFMDIEAARSLLYRNQELVSAFLVEQAPAEIPEGLRVHAPEAIAEDAMRPLERSISSVNLIRVLLWFVAAMIIGTMTYLSALERRRDVAVLKAVGASTGQLAASIALQSALVALAAALVASVLQVALVPIFPLEVVVPGRALVQVPLIAVAVALGSGAVGLRKAVRTDPALAFAGPAS
jgi:predicted acylesterase/phospholipase RssA/CRP-like cAMP-binding protein